MVSCQETTEETAAGDLCEKCEHQSKHQLIDQLILPQA